MSGLGNNYHNCFVLLYNVFDTGALLTSLIFLRVLFSVMNSSTRSAGVYVYGSVLAGEGENSTVSSDNVANEYLIQGYPGIWCPDLKWH